MKGDEGWVESKGGGGGGRWGVRWEERGCQNPVNNSKVITYQCMILSLHVNTERLLYLGEI